MRPFLQRLRPDIAAPALVAVSVLVVAFGSSSPASLHRIGSSLRWVALVALLVAAAAWWLLVRPRLRIPPAVALSAWLAALAVVSAAWSATPRLTFERAVTFVVVVGIALLLGSAAVDDPGRRRLVVAIVAGAVLVVLGGLVVLALAPGTAITWHRPGTAATRYRGLGENPNTVGLLLGIVLPAALWWVLAARGRERVAAIVAAAVLYGGLVASQSRGGIIAAGVGCLLVAIALRKTRATVATVVLLAAALGVSSLRFSGLSTVETTTPAVTAPARHGTAAPLPEFPVDRASDIGNPLLTGKTIATTGVVSSGGRLDAWRGAYHLGLQQPLLGHGFGTEDKVFVDRYFVFQGARPENAYLGWLLQLGLVGVAVFAAVAVALLVRFLRVARIDPTAVAFAGVAAAGLVAGLTQSYVYSAGNIAMLSFWVAAFGLAYAGRAA